MYFLKHQSYVKTKLPPRPPPQKKATKLKKRREKRKQKECLSGYLMRGSFIYSLQCCSIPVHLSPGSHLPASESCLQETCDTDAEENGPAELAGAPLVLSHMAGRQKGCSDHAAEACQVGLQPQKYAQVPGRNFFYGVNHVQSLGVQTASSIQGLSAKALFYDVVFHGAFAMSLVSSFSCSLLDVAPH